jgi:peptidoglycan hydrolase-like protein with peptidoglycan-binding domain
MNRLALKQRNPRAPTRLVTAGIGGDPRNRRAVAAGCALAIVVVLGLTVATVVFRGGKSAPSRAVPTAFARIVRTDVIERQQDAGTLGFRGSYTAFNGATAGVITWLPSPGSIVRRGGRLYELDRRPIPLFYGNRPAYRGFALGMSDGGDVRELKQNLLALDFSNAGRVLLDDHFDLATRGAVKEWQRSLGLPLTGTIALGSVAFLPQAIRIASSAPGVAVGATISPGTPILSGTATEPAVLVQLDPGSVAQLRVGDRVIVTMPNTTTAPGRIASIGRVATTPGSDSQSGGQGSSTPTIPVTISLLHPGTSGSLDQAPVQVAITTQRDRHVLSVPISALLARPGGGYAIQVETGRSTRLVTVLTGLFDDVAGRVEISSPQLRAGLRVVVPAE